MHTCEPCVVPVSFKADAGLGACEATFDCSAPGNRTVDEATATSDFVCAPCETGQFLPADLVPSPGCAPCITGLFQDEEGQAECKTPDVGFFAETPSTQTACNVGHFCVNGVEAQCPAGEFQDQMAQTSCKTPTEGHVINEAQTEESPCAPGHFCVSGIQEQCPPGEFQDQMAQTSCKTPTEGHVINEAQTNESPCALGHFCVNGVEEQCPAGLFQNEMAQTSCKTCLNSFQDVPGQSSCQNCDDGFKVNNVSLPSSQVPCSAGEACLNCIVSPCTAGQFAPAQSSMCQDCLAGTFQDENGQENCVSCATVMGFQPLSGQTGCTNLTVCSEGEGLEEQTEPTPSADRVCQGEQQNVPSTRSFLIQTLTLAKLKHVLLVPNVQIFLVAQGQQKAVSVSLARPSLLRCLVSAALASTTPRFVI